jgi:eukaryotic-like serine/threonine-protein kinase
MPAMAELNVADWHRLNRLLEAALELDEAARSDWISHLPAANVDLVPLLTQLLSISGFVGPTNFTDPPRDVAIDEHPGQRLGPYRLVRQLGQGGMGTVWLAERADGAFERQVALKLPRAEWTDRGLAERFARERAVLASLSHPNIAHLLDAGWSESGRPYLALEYVEGQPIDAWCDGQHLDTAARLRLFVEVIRAVAHAHAQLIVHRDLKPSNVLITTEGHVKLLDFGIAKLLAANGAAAEETELTRAGGRALTPNYAAPEQILGQPISTAADIYTLGLLLFELLSGERPYRLARSDIQSHGTLEEAILRVEAPAPSIVAKDEAIKRVLRGDLDAIVLTALKKQPEHRYQTAAGFADDIERYLDRLPVHARRDSRTYRLRRFVMRNRMAVGAYAAVLVALLAGLLATLWQARVAREEAEQANTIKQFVLSIIQQADPQASQQTRAADVALLMATEQRAARELAGRPELQLQVRMAIATAHANRGDAELARQTLRKAFDEARATVRADNIDLLMARVKLAEWPIEDRSSMLAELDAAIATARVLGKHAIPVLIDALLARLDLRTDLAGSYTAEKLAEPPDINEAREIIALAEQAFEAGHPKVLAAKTTLAGILAGAHKQRDALAVIEPAYRQAQESALIVEGHPVMIRAQGVYGSTLVGLGRMEEGLRLLRDSVELARTHHGSDSQLIGNALSDAALATFLAGDYKRFIQLRREAYAIVAAAEPPGSSRRGRFALDLAMPLVGAFRPHEALPLLDEFKLAIEKLPAGVGRTRSEWTLKHFELSALMFMGETKRARRLAEELLEESKGRMGAALLVGWAQWDLFTVMRIDGEAQGAEAIGDKLVAASRGDYRLADDRHYFMSDLAAVKLALGKWQEALDLSDEAIVDRTVPTPPTLASPENACDRLFRGQALLNLQRTAEAREEFRKIEAFWRDFDGEHPMAAEATWWYGQSLVASGEAAQGKAMVAKARPRLAASRLPHLRPLADAPAPFTPPVARASMPDALERKH